MRCSRIVRQWLPLALLAVCASAPASAPALVCVEGDRVPAPPVRREDLGRGEKLRVLVDKVMQPEEGWVTREWMVRETAAAGFNVFSPRRGHDRLDEVARVNRWCREHGIFHIPWMRGTLAAPAGPAADGKRVLWADGSEQPLWSACSDELWDWMARYIVEYARIAARDDRLIGVFLDYENYWPGGQGNLYPVTYEDLVLDPFLASRGVEAPGLPPAGRKEWLEERGLHDAFAAYQVGRWRERCRELRRRVDEHAPAFRFCVYPAPGTPFIVRACYHEWARPEAPIILADASVYGRPGRFLPQAEALRGNRERLRSRMEIPRAAGIPFLYSGGIDPVVRGADPEFSGRNAVMISEETAGYWVFYEGPSYRRDHREYFRWFSWANQRIRRGDLDAWRAPRETPESWVLDIFQRAGEPIRATPPAGGREPAELADVTLRGENLLILGVRRGQPVELRLRNVPVARYRSLLGWEVRRPEHSLLASGTIPHGEEGPVRFVPEEDGICLLGVSSGSCAYRILRANVPVGLDARRRVGVFRGVKRLWLRVPEGTRGFRVGAKGAGVETVRVTVRGPDGKERGSVQTSSRQGEVELEVPVPPGATGVWSISTGRADTGTLEDYALRLSGRLPPILSLRAEHVFGP